MRGNFVMTFDTHDYCLVYLRAHNFIYLYPMEIIYCNYYLFKNDFVSLHRGVDFETCTLFFSHKYKRPRVLCEMGECSLFEASFAPCAISNMNSSMYTSNTTL